MVENKWTIDQLDWQSLKGRGFVNVAMMAGLDTVHKLSTRNLGNKVKIRFDYESMSFIASDGVTQVILAAKDVIAYEQKIKEDIRETLQR